MTNCDSLIQSVRPGLVATLAVIPGGAAMSVPCVFDRNTDTFHVGESVPKKTFEAHVGPCILHRYQSMRDLATHAEPTIGLPSHAPQEYVARTLLQLERSGSYYQGVNLERVRRAMQEVPVQREPWTCGVNSGARFAAMLGQSIRNYWPYVNGAPKYGFLGLKVGPNPERLQDHLRRQSELQGTDIHQICNVRFHSLWEGLVDSVVDKGRPAMVLFMDSETRMHWVCIIGRMRESGNWYYLDTDDIIWEIPGGDDELKNRMNMGNCLAQKLGFVERFNCIVSTGDCNEKDAHP